MKGSSVLIYTGPKGALSFSHLVGKQQEASRDGLGGGKSYSLPFLLLESHNHRLEKL